MNQAYDDLLDHQKQIIALERVQGLLSWDQEVMMPRHGASSRAEQAGAMSVVVHERRTAPSVPKLLDAVNEADLSEAQAANLRLIRRGYERASRVPTDLAGQIARVTSEAQGIWADARKANAFADFAPALTEVVNLVRQQAECVKTDGGTLYDALLDDYEMGATEAEIDQIFGRLRAGLTNLRDRIKGSDIVPPKLSGDFPAEAQMAMAQTLAEAFGYDWDAGRLDLSVHPFSSGTRDDTRITTRVDPSNPLDCLFSTIHETGHALYEQNLDFDLDWQPAGQSVSMGVHESQSRFCENQIGRSRHFARFLFPRMKEVFGDVGVASAKELYQAINRVEPGFIRTEADEVHYNLHIMMRFDLERALISGDLEVSDLEGAWNERFKADFGVAVPDAARGVLQDVHWSCGLFGYFPTYSLGNIYAGCLFEAMRRDLARFDDHVQNGDISILIQWMTQQIHTKGSLKTPRELITDATGEPPTEEALLRYLESKFGGLYQV